jgi:hypothetical protein
MNSLSVLDLIKIKKKKVPVKYKKKPTQIQNDDD